MRGLFYWFKLMPLLFDLVDTSASTPIRLPCRRLVPWSLPGEESLWCSVPLLRGQKEYLRVWQWNRVGESIRIASGWPETPKAELCVSSADLESSDCFGGVSVSFVRPELVCRTTVTGAASGCQVAKSFGFSHGRGVRCQIELCVWLRFDKIVRN